MVKRLVNIAALILTALVCLIAVSMIIVRLMGGGAYAVLSGSMEPEYHTGSLIYVLPADKNRISKGDVITFAVSEDVTVTHRVVRVIEGGEEFRTKGDANDSPDASTVRYENVLGKTGLQVPYIGTVIERIKTPPGLYIAIAMAVALLMAGVLPLFGKKRGGGDEPKNESNVDQAGSKEDTEQESQKN